MRALIRRLATWPIRAYQRWISPYTPSMCRFRPTCSQYAVEAIGQHGLIRGALYATWRILRCNPFVKGGWDPVPGTDEHAYRERCCRGEDEN